MLELKKFGFSNEIGCEMTERIREARRKRRECDKRVRAGCLNSTIRRAVERMLLFTKRSFERMVSPLFISILILILVVNTTTSCATLETTTSNVALTTTTVTDTPATTTTSVQNEQAPTRQTTSQPLIPTVTPLPSSSDTPIQLDQSDSYESYLVDTSTTTQAANELPSSSEVPTPGPTNAASQPRPTSSAQSLEDRIGLSALIDAPLLGARGVDVTTQLPGDTSSSSYYGESENTDDLGLTTIGTSQLDEEMTTLAPVVTNSIPRVRNTGDELQALESNSTTTAANTTLQKPPEASQIGQAGQIQGQAAQSPPLSKTYFVPETTRQDLHGTNLLENSQIVFGNNQQKFIQDTIIPHTSVNDLLHIIKHLNLINTDQPGGRNSRGDLGAEPVKDDPRTLNGRAHVDRPAPQSIQLFELGDLSREVVAAYRRPLGPDMATLESSSSPGKSIDEADSTHKFPSQRISQGRKSVVASTTTATTADRGDVAPTRRPTNYTLISPYSANFESAVPLLKNIPINRASVATLRDQINASVGANESDSDIGDGGAGSKYAGKSRQTIKIGSKPGSTAPKVGLSQPKSKLKDTENSVGGPVRHRSKLPKVKISTAAPKVAKEHHDQTSGADGNESSSKRGERDAPNKTKESSQRLPQSADSSNSSKSSEAIRNQNNNKSGANQIPDQPPASSSQSDEPQGYQPLGSQSSHPGTQHHALLDPTSALQSIRYRLAQALPAPTTPSITSSYLDDPHKKSYYWTSEQANMYLDDLEPALGFSRPLTIGELARQHGILNDLKFNQHQHYHSSRPVEDFGLISESGLHEQLAPFTGQAASTPTAVVPPTAFDKSANKFKLDEELKQNIAIRAFEAAARDPELSAALFRGLLSLGGQSGSDISQPQQHHQPVTTLNQDIGLSRLVASANALNLSPAFEPKGPLSSIASAATTMQDNQIIHQPLTGGTGVASGVSSPGGGHSPVNLVIADLANKWALSRMPDLVPIPLAATVPGYLIRLPNGKILAAALTNMFSIQGIQREPPAGGYKGLLNHKLKGRMKTNQGAKVNQAHQGHAFANLGSDSGLRPSLALPTGVDGGLMSQPLGHNDLMAATAISSHRWPGNQKKPNSSQGGKEKGGGLFSGTRRGVLNQLSLLASSSRAHNQKQANNQTKDRKPQASWIPGSKQESDSISKAKMMELIKNLPIADPNEPVFSFTDESELIDGHDYHPAASNPMRQPVYPYPSSAQTSSQLDHHQLGQDQIHLFDNLGHQPNHQTEIFEGASSLLLPLKDRLNHLVSLRHSATLASDDIFRYHKRKRKSQPRLSFAKLESILNWIKSKRARGINRGDRKACNDKS